jgi:hypothetical protein
MSTAVRVPVIETAPESPRSLRTPMVHFKAAVPALDAALRSIADNLAGLRLDLVQHLKIAVAIVAPLMGALASLFRPCRRATHGFSRRPLPRATVAFRHRPHSDSYRPST